MDDGTYILVNGIDSKLCGLSVDDLILTIADADSEEYGAIDSQFADDNESRMRYLDADRYMYFYSADTSGDHEMLSHTVTMFRLFELSSFGAGIVMISKNNVISCHHGILETSNPEAERLPLFSLKNTGLSEFRCFCDQYRRSLSDPEWKDNLLNLTDFFNEAYRIDNPQTAYMNLIIAAEIYRKWSDSYMDRYSNMKEVIETENAMRSRGGRSSGTKRIAVLLSRLIRVSGQDADGSMRRAISQLYYQRNDFIHGGVPIDDVCHRMMFDIIRCMIGKMVICDCSKDDLLRSVTEDKVPSKLPDGHFSISDIVIDDLIMSFDRCPTR